MKLACVVHRFGAGIAGGSEAHCRGIAERLAASHDVTVLTTCASDHVTWRNAYPAGVSTDGALTVNRFRTARPRDMHRFADASERVFAGSASEADEEAWFRENGPDVPDLLAHLGTSGEGYDRVLFWSFRYAPTFFGLPLVADRAVLVPTAEADPVMRLDVLEKFFRLPAGLVFLTPEEQELVARRAAGPLPPSVVIGAGVEPAAAPPIAATGFTAAIRKPYVLYLGRIDPNKGCETLVRYFLDYRARSGADLTLVLAGPANMPLPADPAIVAPGFVDAAGRDALLAHAAALVMPSPYESLSMVLLEAWNHGLPALVNGRCAVLKGQALRSGGALYYRSFDEFAEGMKRVTSDPALARALGQRGRAYVDREYRWPHVMGKLERFLEDLGPVVPPPHSTPKASSTLPRAPRNSA